MKALIINGSPGKNGSTSVASGKTEGIFAAEGVETEAVPIDNKDIRGCCI